MGRVIRTYWDKTTGYKTLSAGILVTLFELFRLIWPDAMGPQWTEWTYKAIAIIGGTGILDKIWRMRRIIINFVIDIFKQKQHGN